MEANSRQQLPVGSPSRIRVLDDIVVNQIAAGEVVERPASVVKELVENALDAGASEVTVVVVNGGKGCIEVIDNGCGMSKADALLALERFGTSKIRSVEDLHGVTSFGFRGEALPSIAAVSRFSLCTRPAEDESGIGVEIDVHGGKLRQVNDRPLPHGTRVKVEGLFFNVPARRKFLRAEATETAQVKALLLDVAAAAPNVRLTMVSDGSEVLCCSPVRRFLDRVPMLQLGSEPLITVQREIHWSWGRVHIEGALRQPLYCVSGASRLRILVNGRVVRDRLLLSAVREGYGNFLKPGKYPVGILRVEAPPREVDVNVHPQKSEVRFRIPRDIYASVVTAVRDALKAISPEDAHAPRDLPPHLGSRAAAPVSQAAIVWESNTATGALPVDAPSARELPLPPSPLEPPRERTGAMPKQSAADLLEMRFVGQVFDVYLILEGGGRLALLDMHAAHERVMHCRLKEQLADGPLPMQAMLISEQVPLPPDLIEAFREKLPQLSRYGIDAAIIADAIEVRGIPALLRNASPRRLIEELSALSTGEEWHSNFERLCDAAIARLACHSSIRRGRDLKPEEVYSLLGDLRQAESSAFCPHGRPVTTFLTESTLNHLFGR